ncbi:MAG: creatininase family protein [Bdellovibrionia bacterium]
MKLQEKTWVDVEHYLKTSQTILVPVGSTEQHGPTGILGIDYLTSQFISEEVGKRTHTLVAPPLCFGMAVHHMAFPGTITLTPSTYVTVIKEIIQSLTTHGFKKIIFVNGHGGNIAPLTTAFCEAKMHNETTDLSLVNWWHLPEVVAYEKEVFKDNNGFHATCGEISVTMHTHPEAYSVIKTVEFSQTTERSHWPMSPQEFRQHFPDGRMGSLPQLANATHGQKIFEIAVTAISQKI